MSRRESWPPSFFAGPFLRRLGVLFVERYDVGGRLGDTEAVVTAAQGGRNVIFFPEGTFTRRPGLSAFYLGAFKVAAEAGLPILPGIIRGTRTILRSDQWFPRWNPVSVQIEKAITPSGTDFPSLLQLRDAVRAVILGHCGEPDIAELVKPKRNRSGYTENSIKPKAPQWPACRATARLQPPRDT